MRLNQQISTALEERGPTARKGNELSFRCFHPERHQNGDAHPSARWNEERGVWHCDVCGAGGASKDLARLLDLSNAGMSTPPSVKGETMKPLVGLNLETIADQKRLEVGFLRGLGVSDIKYGDTIKVRIPYHQPDGKVVAVRYRVDMGKGGHRWREGDHPCLYGLDRLPHIREARQVLLVEGETDCWTAWFHGLPAVGIPGKSIWKPEWARYFEGLAVYLWQEPRAEDLTKRVAADIPDLWVIRAPEGIKDISEAHIQGKDVKALITELTAKAVSYRAIAQSQDSERQIELRLASAPVLGADDPLTLLDEAIKSGGYGGDIKPAKIVYLAATSRLLAMRPGSMPVHLLIIGPSSAGKSYTLIVVVLPLLPKEAYHKIDAGSPRVLVYDDAELRHKVLIFGESDSLPAGEDNPVASAIRNLLTDHYLHYQVVIPDSETGQYKVQEIMRDGPTTLITTSTKALGDQMNTRLFHLDIPYDREQICAALEAQGNLEVSGPCEPAVALIAFQAYLQTMAPWDVVVPYALTLAREIGRSAEAPRITRDYLRLLSLIKSVAIIRHMHRETDSDDRLVATLEDYECVRDLVGGMYETSLTGASKEVRAVVKAVGKLSATQGEGQRIIAKAVQDYEGISKMQAYRYVQTALVNGWLVNHEARKGHPYNLALGESLPEAGGLPRPEDLVTSGYMVSTLTDGGIPPYTQTRDVLEV